MTTERNRPCEFCDSEAGLEDRLVTVYRHRGERHFIFERVPARVCKACGHRYFSVDIVERMEWLMDSPDTQAFAQPVPIVALTAK
jgi:YgiT-type zinc finger domain-containing protein